MSFGKRPENRKGPKACARVPCALLLAAAAAAACGEPSPSPEPPRLMWSEAGAASGILQEEVTFEAPAGPVNGLLARPTGPGPHPAVIIVPGSWLVEPYIASTAAMLAQEGFVALAVDVFSYFPKVASYQETESVPWQVTQQAIAEFSTDARIADDLGAGWRFLQSQAYARGDRVGLIGFCGGGRDAFAFAAGEPEVAAIVAFYAPVRLELSHRSMVIELAQRMDTPVQAHYGLRDQGIPLEQVGELEQLFKARGTPAEIFRYDAGHGFFAHNREESFDEGAAREAWGRLLPFLRSRLQ